MEPEPAHHRRPILVALLILVPALFLLGWSQASLKVSSVIRPVNSQETILLLVLSAVIFLAFVIFALILLRILLKLYVERSQQQLGARFKTKMVVAFLSVSLVPVCFLFIFAYGLLNKTIDRWFTIPLDLIQQDTAEMVREIEEQASDRAAHISAHLVQDDDLIAAVSRPDVRKVQELVSAEVASRPGNSAFCFDLQGRLIAQAGDAWPAAAAVVQQYPVLTSGDLPPGGLRDRWSAGSAELFFSAEPVVNRAGKHLGKVAAVTRLPATLTFISGQIQRESVKYGQLSAERRAVKRNFLSMLWLITVLILFIATWFALFLSKQVTIPIQALATGTKEVSQGNLEFQIPAKADDELGVLIQSFNQMTRQLLENRRAIEQASLKLQEANRQLEERGNTIEAILENIPTGVISFDPQGQITRLSSTAERMMGGERVRSARTLEEIFPPEEARELTKLFRRATRQGVVTRQMELTLDGRRTYVALTLSSVQARHGRVGSVLVLEDLSEVFRAQRAAAWQEVAQRIAHEIKNPLTPIQLSTERIRRLLDRTGGAPPSPELLSAMSNSAELIGREVGTLKTLVDEFSAFARFPASKPVPSRPNEILENALKVFEGRLSGVTLHHDLAADLPFVQADPDQMKRVIVNLIDNAAEALDRALQKEIWIRSALDQERDLVEITVADSGPGISPEAKERVFLPYFSTKRSGTGLGLAIVNRIVAEHHGTIRVEENLPSGTRFVIELPVEHAAPDTVAAGAGSTGAVPSTENYGV